MAKTFLKQKGIENPCNDNLKVEIEKDRAVIRTSDGSRVFYQVLDAKCFVDCYYELMAKINAIQTPQII